MSQQREDLNASDKEKEVVSLRSLSTHYSCQRWPRVAFISRFHLPEWWLIEEEYEHGVSGEIGGEWEMEFAVGSKAKLERCLVVWVTVSLAGLSDRPSRSNGSSSPPSPLKAEKEPKILLSGSPCDDCHSCDQSVLVTTLTKGPYDLASMTVSMCLSLTCQSIGTSITHQWRARPLWGGGQSVI
ncbi:hypothetical protein HAX54_049715 [Datura stramonium]|uniref:Uncharacterized protein n=1 Tax=Datura stramonium TaxID=4076 RepID=A0ABS8WPG1_DATST|nr:hypothetical protein [Datura stramonium]